MRRQAALALAAVLAAAPLLSGCIAAAAALPLAAGVALSRNPAARRAPGESAAMAATARSDLMVVATSMTELPPPHSGARAGDPAVAAFLRYALGQAQIPPGSERRLSAIVPNASALRAVRADCRGAPAAVFIDLDPGRASFDPLAPGTPEPSLGQVLAELRGRRLEIVWFSRLGDSFAPAVRAALARAGLDPIGRDRLVLMRGIDERKQSRRDEVARELCPIAMLGDERADFDELYLYLRQPDAAIALDAMIGNGWFLASPFRSASPAPAGVTP